MTVGPPMALWDKGQRLALLRPRPLQGQHGRSLLMRLALKRLTTQWQCLLPRIQR